MARTRPDTTPEGVHAEVVPLDDLMADPANVRRRDDRAKDTLRASLARFGPARSVVIDGKGIIRAGNGTVEAAQAAGITRALVIDADGDQLVVVRRKDWSPSEATAYSVSDNRTGELADWDNEGLAQTLRALQSEDFDLGAVGFTDDEVDALLEGLAGELGGGLGDGDGAPAPEPQVDRAAELQEKWGISQGQLWTIASKTTPGRSHRLLCGDSTKAEDMARLCPEPVQGAFTSPPYAEQRKAQYGGTPADQYVAWWEAVQARVRAVLAPDGSFFVNIKAHCEDGERSLYVMDLVLAMKRRWGWRYVDEFCWSRGAVPGHFPGRFKNGFEPIFHFAPGRHKCDSWAVAHDSDDVMTGDRHGRSNGSGFGDRRGPRESGPALPSNVLEIAAAGADEVNGHAAAFPVALPTFFLRAFSDPGDAWLDPFCGSGTTLCAAEQTGRLGCGMELHPPYVAVILERLSDLGLSPELSTAPNGG